MQECSPMPLERTIVAGITKHAKQIGWWVMKIHGGPYQLSGVPDLLCIKDGRALFLEVKRPGERPTAIQRARMNEIETEGGALCAVVTSVEEADDYLRVVEDGEVRTADDPAVDRRQHGMLRPLEKPRGHGRNPRQRDGRRGR